MHADNLLPHDVVDGYLKAQIPGLSGAATIRQLSGGVSNLTYRIDYPEQSLVLRCAPPGSKAAGAHDMVREAGILKAVAQQVPVPEVYAVCDDASLLGTPFFVMQLLEGVILRRKLPSGSELSMEAAGNLCRRTIDALVALHAVDVTAAGLGALDRGAGYVERQVNGWAMRYRDARTDDVPDCEGIIDWLIANQPQDSAHCLIHNDFRFDNLVLTPDLESLVGVLDWELATVGDPLMDLGASLAYWVQADDDRNYQSMRLQPTHLPGMLTRDQIVAYYGERSGRTVNDFTFYEVYGLFRLAGIAQQIYYRYFHGQSSDSRFKNFGESVQYLAHRCQYIIERGRQQ